MPQNPDPDELAPINPQTVYNISFVGMKKNINRLRRKIMARHLRAARVVFFGTIALVFLGFAALLLTAFRGTKFSEYSHMAQNFLFLPEGTLKEYNGKTNVLLLGIAGDGDKNPYIADTIIFASFSEDPNKMDLISVPRDIWIEELGDKINSAYLHGNENEKGGGIVLTKSIVEEVVGQPVHYAVALDFEGFLQVIDVLGGVEVNVERSFTDERYPIPGLEDDECDGPSADEAGDPEFKCRYETISFDKGLQSMDGETALKYARSRQSSDPEEGNDLARAARQQKVILAIKDKMLSSETLLSPSKLSKLWNTFLEITETDLSKGQMAYLARLVYASRDSVTSHTLPEELLFNPPYIEEYNYLYVFLPASGQWSEIQDWVSSVLGV
jgi:LCP family protein required for cell wall assembly